jgi:hypothetical protein
MPFTVSTLRTELQLPKYAAWVAAQDRASILASINAVDQSIDIKRRHRRLEVLEAIDIRDLEFQTGVNAPTCRNARGYESVTQQAIGPTQTTIGGDTRILKNLKLLLVAAGQGSQARINRTRVAEGLALGAVVWRGVCRARARRRRRARVRR